MFTWWELVSAIGAGVLVGRFGSDILAAALSIYLQNRAMKKMSQMNFPMLTELGSLDPNSLLGSVQPKDKKDHGQYL